VERDREELAAEDRHELPVKRERGLRNQHTGSGADRNTQNRLNQLVGAVSRKDAVSLPADMCGEFFKELNRDEGRISRPGTTIEASEHFGLDFCGHIVGILVLIDLDRGLQRCKRVCIDTAYLRLDLVEG